MTRVGNKLAPAPVRPDVIGDQEVYAFGVPTPEGGRDKVWALLNEAEKQKQAENIYGSKLTKSERVPIHRDYDTIQRDQRSADYPGADATQEDIDNFKRERYYQATESSLGGRNVGIGTPLPLNDRPDTPPVVAQTDIVSPDDPGVQRLSGGLQKGKTSTLGRVGAAISGRARSDIQRLRDEPFGAQKEKAAARDLGLMIAGRGIGLGPQGGRAVGSGFNPGATQGIYNLPGVRNITGPIGEVRDAIGSIGGWDIPFTGQAIPTIAQAGSSFLSSHPLVADFVNAGGVTAAEGIGLGTGLLVGGAAKDAAKTAVVIGDKLAPFHNKVLVPGTRRIASAVGGFHGNYLVPQGRQFHQNVLVPAGREFHQNVLVPSGNAALDGIQRNMNALRTSAEQQLNIAGKVGAASDYILPTTRSTGQVVSGANAQLNRHPDVLPGETDTAPSRVIHTVRDSLRLAGEGEAGSLTPDDVVIRTDIDEKDPVNVRTWAGERRPSAKTKAEFAAGLRDKYAEFYDLNE